MAQRRFLERLRRRGVRRAPGRVALDVAPSLPARDVERLRLAIAELLRLHDSIGRRVEAAAVADAYLTLSDEGRANFVRMLAVDFWTDPNEVDAAVRELRLSDERREPEQTLRVALTPAVTELLHLFTGLDGGVKFLVDLRADTHRLGGNDPVLQDLDHEMKSYLDTLFDVGLLALRRITWDAPAALLEKLSSYEAVHTIQSWVDMKNRLDSDRRCYAFFHPAMPNEPLIFVEIALTHGVATELPPLLDTRAPQLDVDQANTAVFYSISNCQAGLAGVSLGTALIKQVVDALTVDLPQLRRFVTLSPIPGFRSWLEAELSADRVQDDEREMLPAEPARVLARLADSEWEVDEAVRPALLALCSRYLKTVENGRVLDPVANFHLANGACIERVNWLADPSAIGRERSYGLMANYRYDIDRIAERAEAYAARGEICMS